MQSDKKYWFLILVLITVGAFLRLYHLDFNSFWLDEAATVIFTQQSILNYWQLLNNLGEVHPPLFYIVEKLILPFGNSEFLYRLLPALLGIATIPLFYLIGKKMFCCEIGLIMAALLTFSPFHVFFSQDARMYTLLLFLMSVALLFFLKALETNDMRDWVIFGFFSALSLWTHFFAFLFIAILIIFALIQLMKLKKNLSNLLISAIIITILCSPLLLIAKNLISSRTSGSTWGLVGIDFVIRSMVLFLNTDPDGLLLLLIFFCFGSIVLFYDYRTKFYFIFTILLVPSFAGLILSYKMPMDPRYLIVLLPFVFMIIACGVLPFFKKLNKYLVMGIVVALIILTSTPQLSIYYTLPSNNDWRTASAQIEKIAVPGDFIVVLPEYNLIPFDYYYNNTSSGTLEYSASDFKDLERINSLRGESNASLFILFTDDLRFSDISGNLVVWINNKSSIVGDYTGVSVREINSKFKGNF